MCLTFSNPVFFLTGVRKEFVYPFLPIKTYQHFVVIIVLGNSMGIVDI